MEVIDFGKLYNIKEIMDVDCVYSTLNGNKIYDGSIVLFSANTIAGCITNCF